MFSRALPASWRVPVTGAGRVGGFCATGGRCPPKKQAADPRAAPDFEAWPEVRRGRKASRRGASHPRGLGRRPGGHGRRSGAKPGNTRGGWCRVPSRPQVARPLPHAGREDLTTAAPRATLKDLTLLQNLIPLGKILEPAFIARRSFGSNMPCSKEPKSLQLPKRPKTFFAFNRTPSERRKRPGPTGKSG